MTDPDSDPAVAEALDIVHAQYELVPCMERQYLATEMNFRPMPVEMQRQLETSGDFSLPEAGVPVLLNLSSGNDEAGLIVWVHPQSRDLWVLVPHGR